MSPSLSIVSHPFSRERLAGFCAFVSAQALARWPAPSALMAHEIAWQLPDSDPKSNLRLWYASDALVGYGWFHPDCYLHVDVAEAHAGAVRPEIIRWAVERRRAFPAGTLPYMYVNDMDEWADIRHHREKYQKDKGRVLVTSAFDGDDSHAGMLETLGFEATGHTECHMRHDLVLPDATNPDVTVRAIREDEMDDYAAAHRDAWPGSSFSSERLRAVMAVHDLFDPDLCLVAEVDNEFAGTAIFWAIPATRIGGIEPFGVRPAWRGQGVAQTLLIEGLRRVKAKGMRYGRVSTAGFNHQAQRLYQSCGFEVVGAQRSYKRIC